MSQGNLVIMLQLTVLWGSNLKAIAVATHADVRIEVLLGNSNDLALPIHESSCLCPTKRIFYIHMSYYVPVSRIPVGVADPNALQVR